MSLGSKKLIIADMILAAIAAIVIALLPGCPDPVSKCTDYNGTESAPFDGTPILDHMRSGDGVSIMAEVPLYNPTAEERTADVHCDFYLDDEVACTDEMVSVKVCPHGTVTVDLDCFSIIFDEQTVGVTCESFWQ